MDSVRVSIAAGRPGDYGAVAWWLTLLAVACIGCARGPVVAREILSDPAMRFGPGQPIAAPDCRPDQPTDPLPADTVTMHVRLASDPGEDVQGTWLDSSVRAAVELLAGIGLEAGYGVSLDQQLVQKLDGFTGPISYQQTRHGPDAALVLDDGTSVLRVGYRFRTGWEGDLHEPSISARTTVLSRDTMVELGYRRSMSSLTVPASRLPAREPVDAQNTADRLQAAVEQGLLPGWNLRLEVAMLLEEGFLHSPFRLVSLWAQRLQEAGGSTRIPRTEPENHPDSRVRWGAMLRVRRALPALASVLELGAGHGSGTWRVEHTSAQAAYLQRIGDPFTLSLGAGAYHQTRALFYRDDYLEGPPGSHWSADWRLSSFLAYWGEVGLRWTIIPLRGRVLGMFKYLTAQAGFRVVLVDHAWEGPDSNNGFSSFPSVATFDGVARGQFKGGLSFTGWLGIEGGF